MTSTDPTLADSPQHPYDRHARVDPPFKELNPHHVRNALSHMSVADLIEHVARLRRSALQDLEIAANKERQPFGTFWLTAEWHRQQAATLSAMADDFARILGWKQDPEFGRKLVRGEFPEGFPR